MARIVINSPNEKNSEKNTMQSSRIPNRFKNTIKELLIVIERRIIENSKYLLLL